MYWPFDEDDNSFKVPLPKEYLNSGETCRKSHFNKWSEWISSVRRWNCVQFVGTQQEETGPLCDTTPKDALNWIKSWGNINKVKLRDILQNSWVSSSKGVEAIKFKQRIRNYSSKVKNREITKYSTQFWIQSFY